MTSQHFTLKNGLRIVFYPMHDSEVAHCALMIKAGTRNEKTTEEGLAHFMEHMLFKGTRKRKSYHILNRLEVVGGELNAFTSKEETCIHASLPLTYLERALELINDLCFHSVFPIKEMEKEKEVICDEIRTYLDSPGEQIFDDFEGLIYSGNTLGNSILGTENSVRNFKQQELIAFAKNNYQPEKMVLAISANKTSAEILYLAEKYFEIHKSKRHAAGYVPFKKYKPVTKSIAKHNSQCHFMMGTIAHSLHHPDRVKMVLLNNILGGPGMNSRLNLGVREKYGYTYSIESGFNSYTDTGTFQVYLATDKKHLERCIALAAKEMKKLCEIKIGTIQLQQYKQQFKGQMALAQENKQNIVISSAKSMLNFNKPLDIPALYKKIDSITALQLMDVANGYLNTASKNYSSLLYDSNGNN